MLHSIFVWFIQGENMFFITTNLIVTPDQRQETCAEVWFGVESWGEREVIGVAGAHGSMEWGSCPPKTQGMCLVFALNS